MGSFSCLGDIVWFLRLKTEENKYENWKARAVERIYEYGGGNSGKVLPYTPLLKYYVFIVKKLLSINYIDEKLVHSSKKCVSNTFSNNINILKINTDTLKLI